MPIKKSGLKAFAQQGAKAAPPAEWHKEQGAKSEERARANRLPSKIIHHYTEAAQHYRNGGDEQKAQSALGKAKETHAFSVAHTAPGKATPPEPKIGPAGTPVKTATPASSSLEDHAEKSSKTAARLSRVAAGEKGDMAAAESHKTAAEAHERAAQHHANVGNAEKAAEHQSAAHEHHAAHHENKAAYASRMLQSHDAQRDSKFAAALRQDMETHRQKAQQHVLQKGKKGGTFYVGEGGQKHYVGHK